MAQNQRQTPNLMYDEDPFPSSETFDAAFRNFNLRSHTAGDASSTYTRNTRRQRGLSNATVTSIGRPIHLATRPKNPTHNSRDAVTFVRDTDIRDLSKFLMTNEPPQDNWVSVPDRRSRRNSIWFGRRNTIKNPSKAPLQLPDSAVAARTKKGHWYIAIHIPREGQSSTASSLDSEEQNLQPRIVELKDDQSVAGGRARMNSRSQRQRRWSDATDMTGYTQTTRTKQRQMPPVAEKQTANSTKRLTKKPSEMTREVSQKEVAQKEAAKRKSRPFLQRIFSSSNKPPSPTTAEKVEANMGPSVQDQARLSTAVSEMSDVGTVEQFPPFIPQILSQPRVDAPAPSRSQFDHSMPSVDTLQRMYEHELLRMRSYDPATLQKLESKRTTQVYNVPSSFDQQTGRSTSMVPPQSAAGTILSDVAPQVQETQSSVFTSPTGEVLSLEASAESYHALTSNSALDASSDTASSPFEKARKDMKMFLDLAQSEERESRLVISETELKLSSTIPAMEATISERKSVLTAATGKASSAMACGDVESAIAAAREAAEAQGTIQATEQKISGVRAEYDTTLTTARTRLAQAESNILSAQEKLEAIDQAEQKDREERAEAERRAIQARREAEERERQRLAAERKARVEAEKKALQERLEAEEAERQRISAERKATEARIAREKAEALARAEAKALAEVRAAFAQADKEATLKAAEVAETQRAEAMALQSARAEAGVKLSPTLSTGALPSLGSVASLSSLGSIREQDPEVKEMAERLKKMEESNRMMMETLSAVVKMGEGFKQFSLKMVEDGETKIVA